MHVLLPGPPATPTGGFAYDRHMLTALRRAGWLEGVIVVPGAWPAPSAATVALARRRIAALPDGTALLVDGLAFSPLLEVFECAARRLALFVLVHHPLGDETGLAEEVRERLLARERRALALARGIIVTSATTAGRLAEAFGIPSARIRIVRPGVERRGGRRPRRRQDHGAPVLLCVALLAPRKGQDVLLRALARLRRTPWRLRLVGPPRDRAFARRLRRLALALGLARRVAFVGAVPQALLAGEYRAADLFVLPSRHEGFGIAPLEARAAGLPVVASDAGAIAEALAGTGARLVRAGNAAALARALRALLRGEGGGAAVRPVRPRTWAEAGRAFVAALAALGVRELSR